MVIDHRHPGEASPAAAGMLAPGVERTNGAAHRFAVAARERYPAFIDELTSATGIRVPLNRDGILELVVDDAEAERAANDLAPGTTWMGSAELHAIEPHLGRAAGARYHPRDGVVDNTALMRALRSRVANDRGIAMLDDQAMTLEVGRDNSTVVTASGQRHTASVVVLAAGAWSPTVGGLPRPLPVAPVRGQMYSVAGAPLSHVTYGGHGYVVPRGDGKTVIGATMENVGFEVATTVEGMRSLERAGAEIAPMLAEARVLDRWSGLRPVTPDMLPILGWDPDYSSLLYACGHSRNGILLGPLSGDCVAALALGDAAPHDLTPFAIERFATG